MDIFQLKYFVSAASIGNFTLAACENNISQSSFSKQIMNLEDELGVELFLRKNRNIVLTPAGEQCLEYAYKILNIYDEMIQGIESYTAFKTLPVSVSAIPVLLPYEIENVIFRINKTHPDLVFRINELPESSYVLTSLRRRECDFAVMRTDFLDKDLYEIYPIVTDRLIAILPDTHPLSDREQISLYELKNDRLIMPPKDTDLREIAETACIQAGFRPNIGCITSGNVELTLKIISRQKMIYLAFEKVISYYSMSGCKMMPLKEKIISSTAFVSLKTKALTRSQNKVKKFLEKEYREKHN